MKKLYLVTSSINEIIPDDKNLSLLLLGKNCLINDKVKKKINTFEYKFANYHWNDRKKMSKDLDYIWDVSNRLIDAYSNKFNEIHNKNYSRDYWFLFLGQRVLRLVTFLFDRWETLNEAIKKNNVEKVIILKNNKFDLNTKNNSELNLLMHDSEYWNHLVYAYIIKNYTNLDFELAESKNTEHNLTIKVKQNSISIISKNVLNKIKKIFLNPQILINFFDYKIDNILNGIKSKIPIKKNEIYFHSNIFYNAKYQNNLIQKIKQVPRSLKFNYNQEDVPDYNLVLRENINKNIEFKALSNFENFLVDIMSKIIPRSYIEGYEKLKKNNLNNKLLSNLPKAIFIRSHQSGGNLLALEWMSDCIEKGTKLLILQTGGGWQNSKNHLLERFDIKISDKYFSYGKINEDNKKIFSIGFTRNFHEKIMKPNFKTGNIIFTLFTPFGYNSEPSCRRPVGEQWKKYISDQINLLKLIPEDIRNKIIIRFKKRHNENSCYFDYWSMKKKITDNFPNIQIDNDHHTKKLLDYIPQSRLIIATYNASVILETLSSNMPTIMYWDKHFNEINEISQPVFNKLADEGILHHDENSASKHIISNFNNFDKWWNKPSVQSARREFCTSFADLPIDREEKFSQYLRDL